MINRVVLVGRLTRDPELRTTGSGISVATFTLAVDRQFTNAQGERGADFISCVIWRKAAENFCNFTSKGSLVGIDGRIQTRSYDNKDGQRVYVTEVVVDNFSLLESRKDREARGQNDGFTLTMEMLAHKILTISNRIMVQHLLITIVRKITILQIHSLVQETLLIFQMMIYHSKNRVLKERT